MTYWKCFSTHMGWWKTALVAVATILVWLCLWYGPWQAWLSGTVWLRMGGGLVIFLVPGLCIYGLLADPAVRWLNHVTFGFVLSHLFIAFLGTFGRLFHISFELVKFLMMLLGLIALMAYGLSWLQTGNKPVIRLGKPSRVVSVILLMVVFLLASLVVLQRVLSDDDVTYLAYITNWQHANHLDFKELIFGEGYLLQPRFWLMSVPFAQALISDLSGLPGIIILGGYYEPFLVLIAMISWYELARAMKFSRQAAAISVVLQLVFLLLLSEYLHPGAPFINQLSSDKSTATYILAPVFIQCIVWWMEASTRKNLILFCLAGLSMTFMHPISLAYLVFVGGCFILLNLDRNNFRSRLIPLAVLVLILVPQVVFRFIGGRPAEGIPYNTADISNSAGMENLISRFGDTPFYGFNPDILSMNIPYASRFPVPGWFLQWVWLAIPLFSLLFAIGRIRRNRAAQYIFSTFLLCLLVGLPFTGWIFGYFLSAWMLERAVWFFPFGLSTVFLLLSIRDKTSLGFRVGGWVQRVKTSTGISSLPLLITTLLGATIFLLFMRENGLPDLQTFETKVRRYADIAETGGYLDQRIPEQAVVMGSDALNDFIPGVSWKSKLVTYRTNDPSNMLYFSEETIRERLTDRQALFSPATPPNVKLDLLRKYHVRFIVLTRADRGLFAGLLAQYPSLAKMEKVTRFFVVEIAGE